MAKQVNNPNNLDFVKNLSLKPRDDAFNQKMNEYHTKRKALLDAKPSKYLEPEWDSLRDEMQKFRSGYEKPQLYSLREYMLDNDPDEFQIDQIRDDIDFQGVLDAMQKGEDFEEVTSVNKAGYDSAVREKLLSGMSDSLGLDYDDLYNLWLHGTPIPTKKKKLTTDDIPSTTDQRLVDRERETNSKKLLDRYYKGEFDLGSLHDQLLQVHGGNIKAAFEWLLKNARK